MTDPLIFQVCQAVVLISTHFSSLKLKFIEKLMLMLKEIDFFGQFSSYQGKLGKPYIISMWTKPDCPLTSETTQISWASCGKVIGEVIQKEADLATGDASSSRNWQEAEVLKDGPPYGGLRGPDVSFQCLGCTTEHRIK